MISFARQKLFALKLNAMKCDICIYVCVRSCVCVGVWVCVCMCVGVCVRLSMHVCVCVCMHVCVRTCVYARVYAPVCVCVCVSVPVTGLEGPGSNPGEDEIFRPSRPALGPTQPPVKWVQGLSRG